MRPSIWKKYGFGWVTGMLFLITLAGHWLTGWFVYVDEQQAHRQPVEIRGFALQMSRDTLENWQSEFLQLVWQVAGLTYLLYVGSPQSKEEDDRLEDKLDAILRSVDPANAERLIRTLDEKYPGRYTGGI
ncbi:MAG: hypothetical protein IT481_03020 [Gammaproteobacteria bacterium]|nr:hypothetical protein [Gammaproteobacteria bacterium]